MRPILFFYGETWEILSMGFYNVSYCFEDLSQYVIINQVKICKNKFYSLVVSNLYSKFLVFKKIS